MIIEARNIIKEYSRGDRKFLALDGVNIGICAGDFVNIIGRSGSGKSTLLNIIAGMLSPSSGHVYFHGADISEKTDSELSLMRNKNIGFIPQGVSALPALNIIENVLMPYCLYHNDAGAEGYAHELLERFGIGNLSGAYPDELSGGELRRALIARAVVNRPEIVIADEPTSDLDVKSSEEVMRIFAGLNAEGVAILVVSHDLESLKYGKRVFTMESGKLFEGDNLKR